MYTIKKKLFPVFLLLVIILASLGDSCKKKEDPPETPIVDPCPAMHKSFLLSPSPSYGAIAQPVTLTLSWTGAGWNLTYNLYFGTNPDSLKEIFLNKPNNNQYLKNLKLNTTYYWRVEMAEHGQCNQTHVMSMNFTTVPDSSRPYLTASSFPFICSTTTRVNGNVYYEGLSNVTERGIYYGLSASPEKTGTKVPMGNGMGSFSTVLSGLNQTTTYYFKSYAINSNGTFFSSESDFTTGLNNPYQYITDIEGNNYKYLSIGTQTWMAENLKTTKYNDATEIPLGSETTWSTVIAPGYCWYKNDSASYKKPYGGLYNWYAVNSGKLCPTGWHVPSDDEWKTLEMFLGITQAQADGVYWRGTDLGAQLKNTSGWTSANIEKSGNGLNTSGFSAMPGGQRDQWSAFSDNNYYGAWWSSTNSTEFSIAEPMTGPYARSLESSEEGMSRVRANGMRGFSVRCLKN